MQFHTILKQCLLLTYTKLKVLSKAVGVDPSYLSRYSNGLMLPNPATANQLNEDLGSFFFKTIKSMKESDEILDELSVTSKEELIERFKEAYKNSYDQEHQKITFKEPEFSDYLALIVELKELFEETNPSSVIVSLPDTLLERVKALNVKLEVINHPNFFVFIPEVVYFGLHPFENFQKVLITRFSESVQLKEIEMCLQF